MRADSAPFCMISAKIAVFLFVISGKNVFFFRSDYDANNQYSKAECWLKIVGLRETNKNTQKKENFQQQKTIGRSEKK